MCRRGIRRRSDPCWAVAAACERVSVVFAWSVDGLVLVGPADTLVNDWIYLAVVWSGVGSVDTMVGVQEGQWRINKEDEKNNDERGGGGAAVATLISVKFCSCVFVRLVAVVAVTTAHVC